MDRRQADSRCLGGMAEAGRANRKFFAIFLQVRLPSVVFYLVVGGRGLPGSADRAALTCAFLG